MRKHREKKNIMSRVQWLVLIAIGAILITLCCVEVMRGEDPRSANKEALARDLSNLALRAQDYYHRPISKGGGQGTFTGLTCDAAGLAKLTSKGMNVDGTFSILTAGCGTSVELQAVGTQLGTDGSLIFIRIDVFADSTYITFCN
ncbi:MAG TPA: hypothetical protein DGH68_12125 [Bacteroidetes bacterium]|nr:hypothetical protein [Bacteroidota bacterium]